MPAGQLELRDVTLDLAGRPVIAGLDLTVAASDLVTVMGPSGSGKTTLLNLIAGIDSPSAGTLVIEGVDIGSLGRNKLAGWRSTPVGYGFQLYNLVPVLTAFENVELPLLLHKMTRAERQERVGEALERVDIVDRADHYPRQLSGGQEQRVAIARAIVTEPQIIVADEPTGELDEATGEQIGDLIDRVHADGTAIVVVTHNPSLARRASRQLTMRGGRVVGPA